MRTRRTFDAQFKREAVELARNANVTQKRVCEQLGINPNLLSRWRRELERDAEGTELSSDPAVLRKELERAKAELASKNAEIEFLKKAAGYFAQASERGTR